MGYTVSDWVPQWIRPGFWLFVVTYPIRVFVNTWHERTWRNFLLGLPALTGILVLGYTAARGRQVETRLPLWYWNDAQRALVAQDYPKAEMLLNRLLFTGDHFNSEARFALATLYRDTGNTEQAEFLFRQLAPDDYKGNPAAHRLRAADLCEHLNPQSSETEFSRAHHHLLAAMDQKSTEMLLAWGQYELAREDQVAALGFFNRAVSDFPELWYVIGVIHADQRNENDAKKSFESAEQFLEARLKSSPRDRQTREEYALTLYHLKKFGVAERVLQEGLSLDPDGHSNRLLAGFYVLVHDWQWDRKQGRSLALLAKALDHDPNFFPALSRIIGMADPEAAANAELHELLGNLIADGNEAALAHLALGNVYGVEGDSVKARFHFERAYSIDPNRVVILNNLAWTLAESSSDPGQLDRALQLGNAAVDAEPQNAEYLDTRGTILMKMERWNDALTDLERALKIGQSGPTTLNTSEVRNRLADVYDQLGHSELAEEFRKRAVQAARTQK